MYARQAARFDRLLAAARAFAQARTGEIDRSGSASAMAAIETEADEKQWLRVHLAAFEQDHARLRPPQQFRAQDAALNRAYRALMAGGADLLRDSTASKADVRAAQRLWLTYRDAWVAFAAQRYSAIPADSLKADVTAARVTQLEALR